MNNVDYQRPEIATYTPDWDKVTDVVAGERVVKDKTTTYLPKPNPSDHSSENSTRYDQYVDRAVFFNATGRTLDGLIGIAFGNGPEVEVPASMDFVTQDIDGAGGGIENQSHRVLEGLMKTGRNGLLADYPIRNAATSKAQQLRENIHATIISYEAKSIINWRLDDRQKLSLVVLFEKVEEADGFGIESVDQWRELAISALSDDPDGQIRYVVRLWRMDDETGEPVIYDEFIPLDAAGNEWDEIPFQFVGAVDNNAEIDKAPLMDLACLNIAHYRNSAEFEESLYFTNQPTFVISGLDDQWITDHWNENLYIGSRAAIPLPVGADAKLIQAKETTLARTGMQDKELQMVALGGRLLTHGEAIKTAEQSRSETAAAHSVLSLATTNLALAYGIALEWVARFTSGATGAISYIMPTDFTGLNADPNLLNALVAGWQSGALPRTDLNSALRQLGVIDPSKDDDQIEGEIESDGGGLGLDE